MDPRVALVVDDDPDVLGFLTAVLEQDGFRVVQCADGYAGVRAVEEHHPVVITCDIQMPGMDGYATVKRIRSFDDTYIIMISSMADEIDIITALEAGADDYLTKPFGPRELRARVAAMLRRAHPRGEAPSGPAAAPPTPAPPTTAPPTPGPLTPGPATTAPPVTQPPVTQPPVATAVPLPEATPALAPGWTAHRHLELHSRTRTALLDDLPLPLSTVEFDLLDSLTSSVGETRPAAELRERLGIEQPDLEQAMVGLHRTLGAGWIVVVPGVGLRMRP